MSTTRITFSNRYVSPGGRHYAADQTADVDASTARHLVRVGAARLASPEPESPPAPPAPKERPAGQDHEEEEEARDG